ncbi:hypothetical protein C8R47DRAFT_1080522 [Mycena vitilis]|nr:hypothetical protein C8R47DRAFT_1080522 [Mycena vitilis]
MAVNIPEKPEAEHRSLPEVEHGPRVHGGYSETREGIRRFFQGNEGGGEKSGTSTFLPREGTGSRMGGWILLSHDVLGILVKGERPGASDWPLVSELCAKVNKPQLLAPAGPMPVATMSEFRKAVHGVIMLLEGNSPAPSIPCLHRQHIRIQRVRCLRLNETVECERQTPHDYVLTKLAVERDSERYRSYRNPQPFDFEANSLALIGSACTMLRNSLHASKPPRPSEFGRRGPRELEHGESDPILQVTVQCEAFAAPYTMSDGSSCKVSGENWVCFSEPGGELFLHHGSLEKGHAYSRKNLRKAADTEHGDARREIPGKTRGERCTAGSAWDLLYPAVSERIPG